MSSASGVVIREATPNDARAIAEVHVTSWRWAYRDDLPAELLDALSVDQRERDWNEWLAPEPLAGGDVGRRRGVIASSASAASVRAATTARPSTRPRSWRSTSFPKRRVGGSAGTCSPRPIERLRALGYERATLWVMASNDRSRRFYERAGWSWDGTTSEHRFDCANVPIVRYVADL